MTVLNKQCFTCKKYKTLDCFGRNKAKSTGFYGSCKVCTYTKKALKIKKTDNILKYDLENLKKEKFVPLYIKGFLSNYIISDCGRIYNISNSSFVHITRSSEYPIASLTVNGNPYSSRLHILVGRNFVKNTSPKFFNILNHKDGDKFNPHFSNLEWTTQKLNRKHAIDMGLVRFIKGEGHPLAKPVLNLETGIFYPTLTEACLTINLPTQNVSAMLKGKCKNKTNFIYI